MKKQSNNKIFITGGLGFIGSNIIKALIDKGHEITIYDNYSSGSEHKLTLLDIDPKQARIKIVKGSILDLDALTTAMADHAVVYHQAAQLEITKAVSDPFYDLSSNTVGTLNILTAMLKNKISHLINASSACVYGQKSAAELPTAEEAVKNPNWAYGISKLAAEYYCTLYAEMYDLKIISMRYSIVYGENEWYGRAMPVFIKRALQKEPLLIFGDGTQTRDFVHVSDIVNFNIKALEYVNGTMPSGKHMVFNVSTAKGTTILEMATKIQQYVKKLYSIEIPILYDEVKEGEKSHLMDRIRLPNELKNMVLDNAYAAETVHWTPKISFDAGLKRQIQWAHDHLDTWSKMSY